MTIVVACIVGAATVVLMVLFIALVVFIGELLSDRED